MKIYRAQMESFQDAAECDYCARMASFLSDQFADTLPQSNPALLEGVAEQIAGARTYGLLTEQDIGIYVTVAWLLGGDFDRAFPAVQETLSSPIEPELKSQWLEEFATELLARLEDRQ